MGHEDFRVLNIVEIIAALFARTRVPDADIALPEDVCAFPLSRVPIAAFALRVTTTVQKYADAFLIKQDFEDTF